MTSQPLLGETSEGFAGMAMAFTIIFIGVAVGFCLLLIAGTVLGGRFVRWCYPETGLWRSRLLAFVKQAAGWGVWAYFGLAGDVEFFIDSRRGDAYIHAIACVVTLYLISFAIVSHGFANSSPQHAGRNAAAWVAWDFATITVPLYLGSVTLEIF